MKKVLLNLVFIALSFASFSQNYVFEKITTRDGLSQNDVNDIYQDRDGFLWISTHDGLDRYDGYQFKTFRADADNPNSISGNLVYNIVEDLDGNLWIAVSGKGLCKFNLKTEQFTSFKNTPDHPDVLSSNDVTCMMASKDGSVWAGSHNGINIIKPENGNYSITKIEIPGINLTGINDIDEDALGRKWVCTRQGLFIFQSGNINEPPVIINGWQAYSTLCIAGDEIFTSSYRGTFKLTFNWDDLSNFKSKRLNNIKATKILADKSGNLFLGSNRGLYVVERNKPESDVFKEPLHFVEGLEGNNISNNNIRSLCEDKSGIIWIGTTGGGLNKYNPKKKKFRHFTETREKGSLSGRKIRTIYEDTNYNLWIGTMGAGLNFLPNSKVRNYHSGFKVIDLNDNFLQNDIYSIIDDSKQNKPGIIAGIGYTSVLFRISCAHNVLKREPLGILDSIKTITFSMLKDRNGNLWFGTYGTTGLYKLIRDNGSERFLNYHADGTKNSLPSNRIRSLLEDDKGNIWIGTSDGLCLLTPEEQRKKKPLFKIFKNEPGNPSSISFNYILPVFQSKNGTIWVGTLGGGLNKMIYSSNPDSIKFERFTTQNGLPSNAIKGILEDDSGFLWISSNKGLTRFSLKDKSIINYGISDGLQDFEFSELACCKLHDGEMLFGGVNGVTAFFPDEISKDLSVPKVGLTDFQILNSSVKVGQKIHGRVLLKDGINHTKEVNLKYSENSFSIYFSCLQFSSPSRNRFKYILEGFDKDWVSTNADDRIAKYTNLPPGKYTFKLLASTGDGVWTPKPKMVYINIKAPWWRSRSAMVAYVLFFLSVVVFFQRYSFIRIKQKNELLMEHFEKEKIQELSQMKLRFFTNISHEFRTPLALIVGPLEKLMRHGAELSKEKILENYALMHRNASILLSLINQLVDFRKFEQGKMKLRTSNSNVILFLKNIFASFEQLAEDKKIDYQFTCSDDKLELWFDSYLLERIMYNLLSNAFKFTNEGGTIELKVTENTEQVIIQVIDSGVGIPKDMQKNIFHRFYQADRIENRKVGSTGIGLSFTKGLIEMHHGKIDFESEENKGTTFTIKFRKGSSHFAEEEIKNDSDGWDGGARDVALPSPVEKAKKDKDKAQDRLKYNLLFIDDNFELRQFVKDSLSYKYNVMLAENGKDGLDKVHKANPDIIVSDIMMPIMDGLEFCETLKNDLPICHIPLILLTAKSSLENRVESYKCGADAYISKPFDMEMLDVRIQNLIESRKKLKERFRTATTITPSEVTTTKTDELLFEKIMTIVEKNMSNGEFRIKDLASECGLTQPSLNKKIKAFTGLTASLFIRTIRLKRAAQLLATGNYFVSDVTYEVGFTDLKYFRKCFINEFGMTPSEYAAAKKNEGTTK